MALTIYEDHPNAVPVYFESWQEWRREKLAAEPLPPAPIAPADTVFCALCWGAGSFWAAAGNGEGLVPRPCGHCRGTGLVRRSDG